MINKSHKIEYKKLYNKLKSHPINQWITDKGWQWFPHQIQILKSIEKNNSILVQSPTGTGKTLTGFLPSLLNFQLPLIGQLAGKLLNDILLSPS